MRTFRSSLIVVSCLGLLLSQLTGLHMHVDSNGYVGEPEGRHLHGTPFHSQDSAGHAHEEGADHGDRGTTDHDGDRDVSVTDLGAGLPKLPAFIVWLGICLIVVSAVLPNAAFVPTSTPRLKSRRVRWRPPMRAPPLFSH